MGHPAPWMDTTFSSSAKGFQGGSVGIYAAGETRAGGRSLPPWAAEGHVPYPGSQFKVRGKGRV